MSNEIRIAISGMSGCGNSTVTRLVAEKLDLDAINYTFKDLAKELRISFQELRERARTDFQYDRHVDDEQVKRAMRKSCVLGSRLAVWMLKEADLTVYLTAPIEIRAARIASRENGAFDEMLKNTVERDSQDTERYLALYGIDNRDYSFVDMVIDAAKYNQYEICDLIVDRVKSIMTRKKEEI